MSYGFLRRKINRERARALKGISGKRYECFPFTVEFVTTRTSPIPKPRKSPQILKRAIRIRVIILINLKA